MSKLGYEVMANAARHIDEPFRHHFKPINLCEGGIYTVDECMNRGMDSEGYDCSGLAIASLCEAIGIAPTEWPRDLRHTQQLAMLPTKEGFEPGDLRLYYMDNDRIHLGVATDTEEAIHASGLTGFVERSIVVNPKGTFQMIRAIAIESLAQVVRSNR